MTRVNTVKGEMRGAELGRRAADQKIEALKAKRNYLKLQLRYTLENMYAMEARFELAKARVAKSKNIQPKNFKVSYYEKQSTERSRSAQKARSLTAKEKGNYEREKKKWQSMKKDADRASGKKQ